jgi:hypothetical protein
MVADGSGNAASTALSFMTGVDPELKLAATGLTLLSEAGGALVSEIIEGQGPQ